ncbi:hypothetical protein [Acidocella facilis]|uniref:hypothetical protein n=1 Tax=Acidocella facilis TaxID=525 RepID=UPI001B807148|nr:hypothetical protein [Acidocella facilis]
MPAPTLRRLWAEGEKGRKSWALDAYEHFRMELSEWTRGQLPEARDETTIVLFGPTQVGKTTLLLELLGISASALKHVSEALRGGRAAGNSSTSVPMIYHESADEHWRIDNGKPLNAAGLQKALEKLRDCVEADEMEDTRVATLHIPKQYFNPARPALPRVRILDLPGINPTNLNEGKFVRSVAQRYVSTADLVLLITRADDLGFLNPITLAAGGLRALDWRVSSARFCVVTSYAFKLQSVQEWLDAPGEIRDVDALRKRCAEQMGTFGIKVTDLHCLFPLDFGDSWEQASAERRERAGPLMDQLRKELCARITNAADPLGRLRHAHDAFSIAMKLEEEAIARHKEAQEAADKDLRQREADLEKWRQQHARRTKRLAALADTLPISGARDELCLEFEKKLKTMSACLPAADDTSAMKKSYLRSTARRFQALMWHAVADLGSLASESETDHVDEILTLMAVEFEEKKFARRAAFFFKEIDKQLENPMIDGYWQLVPGHSFAEDREQLTDCMEKATTWLRTRFVEACDSAILAHEAVLQHAQKRMQRARQRVQARIEQLDHELAEQQAATVQRKKELAELKRSLAADQQRAAAFDELLRAALRKDLRARRDIMAREPVPARRFLQLVGAVAISTRFRNHFTTSCATTEDI